MHNIFIFFCADRSVCCYLVTIGVVSLLSLTPVDFGPSPTTLLMSPSMTLSTQQLQVIKAQGNLWYLYCYRIKFYFVMYYLAGSVYPSA